MSYHVKVYISSELYNHGENQYGDGWQPLDRATTWVQGALDRTDLGGTAEAVYEKVPAPIEDSHDSFSAQCPCLNETCSYDALVGWWKDYAQCNFSNANDSNMLITYTGSHDGGNAFVSGKFAQAETGEDLGELSSSYDVHGYNDEHDCMHTVLEEIGHNLLDSNIDDDNDGIGHHDCGSIIPRSPETITPMGIDDKELSFSSGENNCEDYYDTSPDGWECQWSNCAESYFIDK